MTKNPKRTKEMQITAIIDTREQTPFDLGKYMNVVNQSLPHGDYSLAYPDLRRWVCVERKSLPDFLACCTKERARFEKELLALRGYRFSLVVCEFKLQQVFEQQYRSQVTPTSVLASVMRWTSLGNQFIFGENHEYSTWLVAKYLELIARDVVSFSQTSLAPK